MKIDLSKLITAAEKQAEAEAAARAADCLAASSYLAETDWYVTRFAETGMGIPAEVLAQRAAAREVLG